jgi:hypothetical protein
MPPSSPHVVRTEVRRVSLDGRSLDDRGYETAVEWVLIRTSASEYEREYIRWFFVRGCYPATKETDPRTGVTYQVLDWALEAAPGNPNEIAIYLVGIPLPGHKPVRPQGRKRTFDVS